MYITESYWGGCIGGSDDSLTLLEHLAEKQKPELPLSEIFSDFGLDQLNGEFRSHDVPLVCTTPEGWEVPIYYAIDLISDLAALLLECKINGSVDLNELSGRESGTPNPLRLTATPEEHALIDRTLRDFAENPLAYEISEMMSEEELTELAEVCARLRQELYGYNQNK